MQDDSSDAETSSSEYESSSEDDDAALSPNSGFVIKSDLFVTGELASVAQFIPLCLPACLLFYHLQASGIQLNTHLSQHPSFWHHVFCLTRWLFV